MPYKHQLRSYRNRDGVRYVGYEDCTTADKLLTAIGFRNMLRAAGVRAFFESHKDGYIRVFACESDLTRARENGAQI